MKDVKESILQSLRAFSGDSLTENALKLFKTLGYNTDRQAPLPNPTYAEFKTSFVDGNPRFNEDKALINDWKYIDFLFQLSKEEINRQHSLFDTKRVDDTIIESYLFFAIELAGAQYTRTALSNIIREINKLFPMPAMILFKYGESLTLAVINRRLHKRDESKDVLLKKVTLIKDINITNPHRAHIEILFDLSFNELLRKHKFTNFVELHNAWRKTLDTKELNKRFYRELSNWYFWAMDHVSFPDDGEKDRDIRNSTNLIRFITRIIFIWFIKEKGLVPELLFDRRALGSIVRAFAKDKTSSNYYKAIQQNLFFGTLNQTMDERGFAKEGSFAENRSNYGVKNLFRYADLFAVSEAEALSLFKDIPFLNGGLFDCLDKQNEDGKVLYADGFSRNPRKQATVPDFLFFGAEEEYDLNEVYGTKNKRYKVQGLIELLSHYKFTVAENTPIEEEVALDPELLGKVFENLLASYNPETKTTARKQTGSFNTPREIVDYMVDQSVKAYLKGVLVEVALMSEDDAQAGLDLLFEYTEKEHLFNETETQVLIDAIDKCKIIDLACGSGAFPMGVLHKMVHILHKLDPKNKQWKQKQIDKVDKLIDEAQGITDTTAREQVIAGLEHNKQDIEDAFGSNELDYGRKLYLIENCIYGVDIQPIAVQISKLRFFISLIIDQRKQPGKENLGIRSLPNLETKFVAANTLIGLKKPKQMTIKNPEIDKLENDIKELRHKYFSARTRREKMDYQRRDKAIRQKIAELLINDGWGSATAQQIVQFDPYDQNASAPFFDPEWMFGLTDGFDVVIGNPPYIKEDVYRKAFDGVRSSSCYQGKMDLWYLFGAKAIDLLKVNGVVCFIATNNWISNDGASKFRDKVINEGIIRNYIDFGNYKVFSAGIQTMVFVVVKNKNPESYRVKYGKLTNENTDDEVLRWFLRGESKNSHLDFVNYHYTFNRSKLKGRYISFIPPMLDKLIDKIETMGNFCLSDNEVFSGIDVMQDFVGKAHIEKLESGYRVGQGVFVLHNEEKMAVNWNNQERAVIKPYYTTKEINKYRADPSNQYWILYTGTAINSKIHTYPNIKKHLDQFQNIITSVNKPYGLHRTREESIFIGDKILSVRKCLKPSFSFVNFPCYVSRTFLVIKNHKVDLKYLTALLNSSLIAFWLWHKGKLQGNNYQVDKEPLMQIPVIAGNKDVQITVSTVSNYIMHLTARRLDSFFFESLIDAMVYELYFPDEIKAAGCEVLKHLTNLPELKGLPAKGSAQAGDWSDEQKLAVIEKLHSELSDPAHPVSIAMTKMKTVPAVQIIEGRE